MSATTPSIRLLEAADVGFLRTMLYAALFWRPDGERPPFDTIITHPYVMQYHEGWSEKTGDTGFVAELAGEPVGAVWYRFFTDEQHGDGYIDQETPELAIAVADGRRGRGIGRALMEAIHVRAHADGVRRIGISVNADNPAKRLYISLGYVDYLPPDAHERMVLELP